MSLVLQRPGTARPTGGAALGPDQPDRPHQPHGHNPVMELRPAREARADRDAEQPAEGALGRVADDQLVLLVRERQAPAEPALAELYERYSAAVFSLALRMLGDRGLAEEVLQETFWRVWRAAAQYEPGRVRLATWLLRITTNLCISERRRLARRPQIADSHTREGGDPSEDQPDPADTAPSVSDQVWRSEQRRVVLAALEGLPPEQRQAVELAYFGGFSHAEVAAHQAAPLSTVKTRIALGLRKLADYLREARLGAAEMLDAAEPPTEGVAAPVADRVPFPRPASQEVRRG